MKFIIYDKAREESQVAWKGRTLLIGRRVDADIRVDEPTMSGRHAEIFPAGEGLRIRDLESLNGTRVNGQRITESALAPGDEIKIGRSMIVVAGPTRQPSSATRIGSPASATKLTQTVKVHLDELRQSRGDKLRGDDHILLLRNLFESLESASGREDVLERVRGVLQKAFRRARVFIFRPDGNGSWEEGGSLTDIRRPSSTFAAEAARSTSAILSTSLPQDERFSRSESARISGIETAIAAPASCDGEPVAVLYVDRLGMPAFNRRDLNVLGIAANHVTAVLDNVARIEDLRRTNAELMEARESLAELNRNLERLVDDRTAEIQRQADEIARLAEAKDELLGIAAHDIRGPLTVIQGTTELLRLRAGELDPETLARSLDLMHDACRGLTQLLSELLDAKAIESGKITLRPRPYAVERLLEDALPVARLAADDKNVALEIEVDEGLELHADPQRLGQAITNLALNAVKFSRPGTRILLSGRAAHDDDGNELIQIEVEDQGIGIPEKELEGIFGTFEQGEAGRQLGGSGLGLMIAKRIVELHGGTLAVRSQVGVGTRFILGLPQTAARPSRVGQASGG